MTTSPVLDATQAIEKVSRTAGSSPATGSPLPFLGGTKIQWSWDSTSLGWFKTCPRLYQYHMIEGWRPKGGSVHLEFGSLYHSALEGYDKRKALGQTHEEALYETVADALEATWERGDEPIPLGTVQMVNVPKDWGHNLKTRETLIRSIIWYLDQFKDDATKTVILANGKPAVELSFRFELDWGPPLQTPRGPVEYGHIIANRDKQPYVLCGHLDRLVEFNSDFYVSDRKTTSTTPGAYYFDGYSPDNQMSLYTLAAKIIYKTPVKGVIIDAAQIAVGFTRFARGFTHRTDTQLNEWLSDTRSWLALAEQYATAGHWPMNDKSCHQYGGCTFRKVCSKSPEVRQKFLESDFEKRPWNPLQAR